MSLLVLGNMLVFESVLPSLVVAREKWLKPGGVMLPDTAKLYMAPIADGQSYEKRLLFWDTIKDKYNVDMSALKPYAMKCLLDQINVQDVNSKDVTAEPAEICSYSLESVKLSELPNIKSSFTFKCSADTTINGFVTWFIVSFPDGSCLSTSPYDARTHWKHAVIYIDQPVSVRRADIIAGSITITPNPSCERFLNVRVNYRHNKDEWQQILRRMDDRGTPLFCLESPYSV